MSWFQRIGQKSASQEMKDLVWLPEASKQTFVFRERVDIEQEVTSANSSPRSHVKFHCAKGRLFTLFLTHLFINTTVTLYYFGRINCDLVIYFDFYQIVFWL